MSKSRSTSITTGPFYIPHMNSAGTVNNRLLILITNPTNIPLGSTVRVDYFSNDEPGQLDLPGKINLSPNLLQNFGQLIIPANSTHRLEMEIPQNEATTIRVIGHGDYAVDDGRLVRGKLQISSVVGFGNESNGLPQPGLAYADPSTFFRFSEYVTFDD